MNKRFFILWKTATKSGWNPYFSPISYATKKEAEEQAEILSRHRPQDGHIFVKIMEVEYD